MPKNAPKLSEAIREAAKRQGLGVETYRRKHDLANAYFYGLLRDEHPIPEKTREPLRKLRAAGVKHPLLDMV